MGGISYRKELWTVNDRREWWEQYCAMVNRSYADGSAAGSGNLSSGITSGARLYAGSGRGYIGSGFAGSGYVALSSMVGSWRSAYTGSYRGYTGSGIFAGSGYIGSGTGYTGSGLSSYYRFGSGAYMAGSVRTSGMNGNIGICGLGYGMQLI